MTVVSCGCEGAHLFAVVTGLLLIYFPFGSGVLHVVLPILITFAALHLVPRRCGTVVWCLCFPHLIYMYADRLCL